MKVVFVGRGRVGRTLAARVPDAVLLASADVAQLASLAPSVVVLTVPDPELGRLDALVAPLLHPPCVVLHCAGARDASVLARCESRGLPVGVMHPLVSFARADSPPRLAGTTFVIAGDPAAVAAARGLANAVGATPLEATVHGPAYHAAAALFANGMAALAHVSLRVLERVGLDRRAARTALAGLARSVADNLEHVGLPAALTGPIVRGDAQAVRAHRAALAPTPDALAAYDAVAPVVLACAVDAGLDAARAKAVQEALAE